MLEQFSLDDKDSGLARLVGEFKTNHGELTTELQDKIDSVVKEFSLDKEDSALNRLVKNVDRAQQTITRQFSLDDEASALSRLKKELLQILGDQSEENQEFQREVRETLQTLVVRRQEAERSTRHGLEFEAVVGEFLQRHCQQKGDVFLPTGNETGLIKNCKIGDFVVELGPDSAAPAARIVIEAKEKQGYTLDAGRKEIDQARQNRGAQIGVLVFSKKTAPPGLELFARYGDDLYVVWDAENSAADIQLLAAPDHGPLPVHPRAQAQRGAGGRLHGDRRGDPGDRKEDQRLERDLEGGRDDRNERPIHPRPGPHHAGLAPPADRHAAGKDRGFEAERGRACEQVAVCERESAPLALDPGTKGL